MGEDWKGRTEKVYKHSLRRKAEKLAGSSIFVSEEIETITYPCQLVDPEREIPIGVKLTIFQRSEGAKVAVLLGTEVIASVEGEPAKDLKAAFSQRPDTPRIVDVLCVSATKGAPWIEVSPTVRVQKKVRKP